MARDTKAEREARLEKELEQEVVQIRQTWNLRFAKLMYEYGTIPSFSVSIEKGEYDAESNCPLYYKFTPDREVAGWAIDYVLPVVLSTTYANNQVVLFNDTMESAEGNAEDFHFHEEERQRKERVRQSALNKLSKEERELLGINNTHNSFY